MLTTSGVREGVGMEAQAGIMGNDMIRTSPGGGSAAGGNPPSRWHRLQMKGISALRWQEMQLVLDLGCVILL